MPSYIITWEPGYEQKVEDLVKASVNRLQFVVSLYMDCGYEKKDGRIEMHMRMRQPFAVAARAGGVDASATMTAMATQGMMKLNEKFNKEGIKARVESVVNES
jgi:hypothetical protein